MENEIILLIFVPGRVIGHAFTPIMNCPNSWMFKFVAGDEPHIVKVPFAIDMSVFVQILIQASIIVIERFAGVVVAVACSYAKG